MLTAEILRGEIPEQKKIFPFTEAIPREVDLVELAQDGLRVAVASRGELASESLIYLSQRGWDTSGLDGSSRALSANVASEVTVFKLRATDAIQAIKENAIDIAIVGADIIAEDRLNPEITGKVIPLNRLSFGACTFRIGFPIDQGTPTENEVFQRLDGGEKIATSMPNILTAIFKQRGYALRKEQLVTMTGGLESAVALYKDVFAVADRFSTGNTMLQNALLPRWTLWQSPGAYLATGEKFYRKRLMTSSGSAYLSWENYVKIPPKDLWI